MHVPVDGNEQKEEELRYAGSLNTFTFMAACRHEDGPGILVSSLLQVTRELNLRLDLGSICTMTMQGPHRQDRQLIPTIQDCHPTILSV